MPTQYYRNPILHLGEEKHTMVSFYARKHRKNLHTNCCIIIWFECLSMEHPYYKSDLYRVMFRCLQNVFRLNAFCQGIINVLLSNMPTGWVGEVLNF